MLFIKPDLDYLIKMARFMLLSNSNRKKCHRSVNTSTPLCVCFIAFCFFWDVEEWWTVSHIYVVSIRITVLSTQLLKPALFYSAMQWIQYTVLPIVKVCLEILLKKMVHPYHGWNCTLSKTIKRSCLEQYHLICL